MPLIITFLVLVSSIFLEVSTRTDVKTPQPDIKEIKVESTQKPASSLGSETHNTQVTLSPTSDISPKKESQVKEDSQSEEDISEQASGGIVNSQLAPVSNSIAYIPFPTCRPRPPCLDASIRCMIAETPDMCPPRPQPEPTKEIEKPVITVVPTPRHDPCGPCNASAKPGLECPMMMPCMY